MPSLNFKFFEYIFLKRKDPIPGIHTSIIFISIAGKLWVECFVYLQRALDTLNQAK